MTPQTEKRCAVCRSTFQTPTDVPAIADACDACLAERRAAAPSAGPSRKAASRSPTKSSEEEG